MELFRKIKVKAKELKRDIRALYLAYKRQDVTWYAKAFAALVIGYALSPIDLVPDFIPILGYLDDLILIPLGIHLALKLIPEKIMMECRSKSSEAFATGKPKNWIAGSIIILLWVTVVIALMLKLFIYK